MSFYKYFKPTNKSILPSPEGPLSREIPLSHTEFANKKVTKVLSTELKKRGVYMKYSHNARVGNYALLNGTSAAVRHFQESFQA